MSSGHISSRGHFLSHDWHHLQLQPCSSNVPKTWPIGLLQPLPGEFTTNDVTSGSLPAKWSHVGTFPVQWPPPPASYSPVGDQTYPKLDLEAFYRHFQVISNQMTSLQGHFRSREGMWVLQQSDCPWEEICGPETGTVGLLHAWARSLWVWQETPTVQLALSNSSTQKPLYAFETHLYIKFEDYYGFSGFQQLSVNGALVCIRSFGWLLIE